MEHKTPEWEEPKCFEGHLNEEQLALLEKQDPRREMRTALMLSQLSQGMDFGLGWVKLLVGSVRTLETQAESLREENIKLSKRVDTLESKVLVGQWLAVVVGGAILLETVKKLFSH